MKTVLITAYAVNPYKGSEDGMGWSFILQAARSHRVVAVTRENNQPPIDKFLAEHPELAPLASSITFLYFDLPAWTRWWKKGPLLSVLYFYLWQLGLGVWLWYRRPLVDLVHNLNFHNDWTPSFLWLLGRPLVWGPIGHHPPIPASHLRQHGALAYGKDRLLGLMKHAFWQFDPFLGITQRSARRVLCMNSTVAPRLRLKAEQFEIVPSVAVDLPLATPRMSPENFTVMIAARMVPLKGFDMVIEAFAEFYHGLSPADLPKARLLLIGSGPEEKRLHALLAQRGVAQCTQHLAWLDRAELLQLYGQASVFFFPSHEGAGMVVAEAMSYGVPVLCYQNEGPGELVPPASCLQVPYASFRQNIHDFAALLTQLFANPALLAAEAQRSRAHVAAHHTWARRGQQLQRIYQNVLAQ
ncbi:glycosyltransferase family 4 protein [Hymenobacter mucosus]|uniref:Glycosyltransferase involved in cell wall bisynthesis n=1 Tax=Hymenobacter mucosus TaxID=1411120 RepID=A0A238Z9W3_9BACT|nr:glycosyltransferase [Hymenobacter mucosus]SNR79768.1 Glycosyltransferase involved in cell wall bisynthesis [Hymenobacter mucosus]